MKVILISMSLALITSIKICSNTCFNKEKWQEDKYGEIGYRAETLNNGCFGKKFSEKSFINKSDVDIIKILGQPDISCLEHNQKTLTYYFEGYRYTDYIQSDTFLSPTCEEGFPFPNSSISFEFDSLGKCLGIARINAGG